MAKTTVITCNCNSKYQDTVYGINKRLANVKGDSKDSYEATCTVCGKEVRFKNPITIVKK